MGLNESKGNMYEFVTNTWNTIKGKCPHGCTYCYMQRWGEQKPVRFAEGELKTDLGSGNFIFVGSSCDMFAEDIPSEWIAETLTHCSYYRGNRYLFQTKNPRRLLDWEEWFDDINAVICTTIETNRWYADIMHNSPLPDQRALWMSQLPFDKYVTIEPIIDFDLVALTDLVRQCTPEQVNIGADSGNNGLPEPSADKIMTLIEALQEFTAIAQKKNLSRLLQKG